LEEEAKRWRQDDLYWPAESRFASPRGPCRRRRWYPPTEDLVLPDRTTLGPVIAALRQGADSLLLIAARARPELIMRARATAQLTGRLSTSLQTGVHARLAAAMQGQVTVACVNPATNDSGRMTANGGITTTSADSIIDASFHTDPHSIASVATGRMLDPLGISPYWRYD
jgi:hypothetical protein